MEKLYSRNILFTGRARLRHRMIVITPTLSKAATSGTIDSRFTSMFGNIIVGAD
jgi:hypothetical protein